MNPYPVTEADLHAYVDGLLSVARRQEIEDYLASRPEEQTRVAIYRAQNQGLRALFNPVLDETVPSRLSAGLAERPRQFARRFSFYAAGLLIAVSIAAVSGVSGWMLHGASAQMSTLARSAYGGSAVATLASTLPRQAAIAHAVYSPDLRRPVEIGADHEEQLVAWLSKRLGSTMRPPKLGALGYALIGGRLLPGEHGPVAQFMYQDDKGQKLTLYVSTDQQNNHESGFRFAQEGAVNVFYWIDGKFGYALSAGIDRKALARVADAVYAQLEKPA
jgi:anti-sigma factor RsiW